MTLNVFSLFVLSALATMPMYIDGLTGLVTGDDEITTRVKYTTCDKHENYQVFNKCRRLIVDDMNELYKGNKDKVNFYCQIMADDITCEEKRITE